jgi:hypothetical protein
MLPPSRPAYGLHEMRDGRRGRPAELERAAGLPRVQLVAARPRAARCTFDGARPRRASARGRNATIDLSPNMSALLDANAPAAGAASHRR